MNQPIQMKIFSGKTCRFEKLKYFTVMISTLRTNYILQHFLVLSILRTNCIWRYFLVLSILRTNYILQYFLVLSTLRTNYILQYLLVTQYIGAQALFSASAAAKVMRKSFIMAIKKGQHQKLSKHHRIPAKCRRTDV